MSSPPSDAILAQAVDSAGKLASELPLSLSKAIFVVRAESDDLEICHAKIVRHKKYAVLEKVTVVHLKDGDGHLSFTPL